jgi:hypothetical protein
MIKAYRTAARLGTGYAKSGDDRRASLKSQPGSVRKGV